MASEWIDAVVVARAAAARNVVALAFEAADGAPLPAAEPGAHIDVEIAPGLVRPYSLCGRAGERHRYTIAVLREPSSRGGSAAVHDRLMPGARLRIGRPRNLFALAPSASHSLLLAGGIGITPILAMADRLAEERASFTLHYWCRSPGHRLFADRIAASPWAERIRFHMADAGTPRVDPADVIEPYAAGAHLYVCGPGRLMERVLEVAEARGWPPSAVHRELFDAGVDGAGDGFELRLVRSGRTIAVSPGQTAVAALAAAGIEVPVSCEQGICGTCLTGVLEGVPDHRDLFLTGEEHAANDQFTPCCSRSKTPVLVLDL